MTTPDDTPDIEALRAELARILERTKQLRQENDALEKSLISRSDAKHKLQAEFLAVEEKLEQFHKQCVSDFVDTCPPEVAEALSKELRTGVDDALSELREGFIAMVNSFKAETPSAD